MYNLGHFVALTCCKISFLAIYAVLSKKNCRNLRAFVWRKVEPKIVSVEKKGQISCMVQCAVQFKVQSAAVMEHDETVHTFAMGFLGIDRFSENFNEIVCLSVLDVCLLLAPNVHLA